jgi:hypothetical protein
MQLQVRTLDFSGQNIYAGIDTHKKSWQVSIYSDELYHKTFNQPPHPEVLHRYLCKHFPNATYYSVYEAGFCGFWIHDRLQSLGINNIVVNPADVPTTDKEKNKKQIVLTVVNWPDNYGMATWRLSTFTIERCSKTGI